MLIKRLLAATMLLLAAAVPAVTAGAAASGPLVAADMGPQIFQSKH